MIENNTMMITDDVGNEREVEILLTFENDRGTAEYYNCLGQVDIITGTFIKSFGCVGGFVAASEKLI